MSTQNSPSVRRPSFSSSQASLASTTSATRKQRPSLALFKKQSSFDLMIPNISTCYILDPVTSDKMNKSIMSSSYFIKCTSNDASIGLFRIQEHIQKRSVSVSNERAKLAMVQPQLEIDSGNVKDVLESINQWKETVPETLQATVTNSNKIISLLKDLKK
ncbi:hypothetical protein MP638_002598 [Amoeboaphelidium occidentale]|nr:hypothetical protein MP638_002598 [Amoeboaphelidium occidentale]